MILLYRKTGKGKLIARFNSWWNAAEWCSNNMQGKLTPEQMKKYYLISRDKKEKS